MKSTKLTYHQKAAILRDMLRHASYAYLNEEAARNIARKEFADYDITIIHSPHGGNPIVNGQRADYWIDEAGTVVRTWERVLFEGYGSEA